MTRVIFGFLTLFAILLIVARVIYGGGVNYVDVNTAPMLDESQLEIAFSNDMPIGNIATTGAGDLFFTVHPDAKPEGNKLLRVVDGVALPFPNAAAQQRLFNTPLGLALDARNRVWVIDHGNHASAGARLFAFDISDGALVYEHAFNGDNAPLGSMLQDLAVTADGNTVFVADASILRRQPALVVHNVTTNESRRILTNTAATSSQGYRINNSLRTMQFLGGVFSLMPGLDGLALDPAGDWLYLGAMSNDGLYRAPVTALLDESLVANQLDDVVERYSDKPLSDGLSAGREGTVYVTDVEHHAIIRVGKRRRLQTIIRSRRIRWPDATAFDDDGNMYISDISLPLYLLQSPTTIAANAPYHIYRIPPVPVDAEQ